MTQSGASPSSIDAMRKKQPPPHVSDIRFEGAVPCASFEKILKVARTTVLDVIFNVIPKRHSNSAKSATCCPECCPEPEARLRFVFSDVSKLLKLLGSPGRIRTNDQPVNSRLLYH